MSPSQWLFVFNTSIYIFRTLSSSSISSPFLRLEIGPHTFRLNGHLLLHVKFICLRKGETMAVEFLFTVALQTDRRSVRKERDSGSSEMGWISISGWKFWRISASIGTPSDHSAIVLERSITENIVDSHSCSSSVLSGPSTPVMSENLGRRLFTSPSSGYSSSSTSTIKSWRSFSSTISWRGWHESIDDSDGTRDVEELQGDLVIRTIEWRTGKQSRNFK